MSTTIDNRVVEMRFDNKHFESNVKTTMSTLDRLKEKLNLSDASKGLDNVSKSAKNVNLSPLGNAVETVHAKFSALEVIGVTALANITNSAVNAGKRIVSALTIDPIETGFQEYETQINAVQTILANTSSKGSTIKDVNNALSELNTYADKTIYNFTEMTRNIGTFTAAGVNLDTSVNAIQGIANLAAVSGSNSQQASTAMYQLSQALAAGTVKLMDWNSVVNAGMGGEMFQNALKETSELLGTGAEAAIKAEGSFRESLRSGWLTSEVLTETLKKFTTTGANERVAEYTGLSKEAVEAALEEAKALHGEADAIDYASKALAEKSGKNAEEIKATLEFARTAEDAATKVKTFTQLWDVLKESAQSGWTQTWQLLFGDFEEAKGLFTPLADFLTGIINKMSDFRNTILKGALESPFAKMFEKINDVTKATKAVSAATKEYANIVDKVIGGEFGTGQSRWDKLTEEGYDWAKVQNMVNEKLGDSTRHTEQLTEAQKNQNETQAVTIERLAAMTDAGLRNLGFTEQEIEAFRELQKQCDAAGISLKDAAENTDLLSGRTLLINSFKNAGQGLVSVCKAIGDAWRQAFHGDATSEEIMAKRSQQLYGIIAAIHKFSTHLIVNKETTDKLVRTFKGLFAVVDILTTIFGGGLKIAFKAVNALLKYFDMDILTVTADIGDALVGFRDFIDSLLNFEAIFSYIVPGVKALADGIIGMKNAFMELPMVQSIIDNIRDAFNNLKDVNFREVGSNIIAGLINGISSGAGPVIQAIINIASNLIDAICNVLGIHSPSVVFFAIGKWLILGLIAGIVAFVPEVRTAIANLCGNVLEGIGELKLDDILAGVLGVGVFVLMKKFLSIADSFTEVLGKFAAPFEGLADVFEGISGMFKGLEKNFKAMAFERRANGIKSLAIAIAIMAGAIVLLTKFAGPEMWEAIGAIGALAVIMGLFALAAGKLEGVSGKIGKPALAILALSASILILAIAMNKLAKIKGEDIKTVVSTLTAAVLSVAGLIAVFGIFVKADKAAVMDKAGIMISKMAFALLLMVGVIKLASMLDDGAVTKGLGVVLTVGAFFGVMVMVSRIGGEHASKAGGMLLKMAGALLIMVAVIKLIDTLSAEEILKGIPVVIMLGVLFSSLISASKLAGDNATKAGFMLLGMSMALAITVGVIKMVSKLDGSDLKKGMAVVAGLELLFAGLIAVSYFAGKNALKAGGMLMMMSGALIAITGVLIILSMLEPAKLFKSLAVVTVLELLFGGLILVTHWAQDVKSTLVVMTVAIGMLVAAMAILTILDPAKLAIATACISAVLGVFAGLIYVTKFAKNTKGVRKTLITLLGITAILAGIIAALSFIPNPEAAVKTSVALGLLMKSFAAALLIMGKAGKISKTVSNQLKPMLEVAIVMTAILAIFGVLNKYGLDASVETSVALGVLMDSFAGALFIMARAGKMSTTVSGQIKPMLEVAIGLAAIMAIFGVLNKFGMAPSIETTIALGVLMNAFSSAMLVMSKSSKVLPTVSAQIKPMMLVVAELAAILAIMSFIPNPVNLIPTALALGVLLNAFASAMLIISHGKSFATLKPGIFVGMGAIILELAAILGVMSYMGVEASIPTAIALGVLLNAMAAAMLILGFVSPNANKAVGSMVVLGLVVGELAVILGLMQHFDVQPSIDAAIALSILLGSMSASLVILGLVGKLGAGAFIGIGALATLIAAIGGLVVGIGALMTEFPQLEEFLNKGLPVLGQIGNGIGSFFGNLISGFADAAMSALPQIGTYLSDFMTNASVFIEGTKNIDQTAMDGVWNLAGAILALTGASFVSGIMSFLPIGTSFAEMGKNLSDFATGAEPFFNIIKGFNPAAGIGVECLADAVLTLTKASIISGITSFIPNAKGFTQMGKDLSDFVTAAKPFFDVVKSVDASIVESAACVAKMILALTVADIITGIAEFLVGDISFKEFGEQLIPFGEAIAGFSQAVKGKIDTASVEAAASAGETMANLQKNLYGTGGIIQWFCGEKDFATFGSQLEAFGKSIVAFSDTVAGKIDADAVEAAAKAGDMMASMQKNIYGTEGIIQWFCGEKDFATFGSQLEAFGKSLVAFSNTVSAEGAINEGAIETAKNMGSLMTELQSSIEPAGGLMDLFAGSTNLDDFGTQLEKFGTALVNFSATVSGEGAIDSAAIDTAQKAGMLMSDLQKAIPEDNWFDGKVSIDDFGKDIKNFGKYLSEYSDKVDEIDNDKVTKSITAGNNLVSFVKRLSGFDPEAIKNFKIESLGKALEKYANSIAEVDIGSIAMSTKAGTTLLSFINGLNGLNLGGIAKFKAAIESLGNIDYSVLSKDMSGSISKLKNIGTDIINAITLGVNTKKTTFIEAMSTMVDSAATKIITKKAKFKTIGSDLANQLAAGIKSADSKIKGACLLILTGCVTSMRNRYESFKSAGSYVVSGFANGIKANTFKAEAQAKAMAKAALEAAEEALGIHSPSKEFHTDGEYSAEGMAEGIEEGTPKVEEASENMAKSALQVTLEQIQNGDKQLTTALDNYWSHMLAANQKGVDAKKYQDMDLVEFEKEVLTETTNIWKEYTDQLSSKTDSIMGQVDLFSEVTKPETVKKEKLMKNLEDQVKQYETYAVTLATVNARVAGTGLAKVVQEMGVDSLGQLQAINSMTDEELSKYAAMYDQKFALATNAAATQLTDLQTTTEAKLSDMFGGVKVDAIEFGKIFDGSMESIEAYVAQSIDIEYYEKNGANIITSIAKGISENTEATEAAETSIDNLTNTVGTKIESAQDLYKLYGANPGNWMGQSLVENEAIPNSGEEAVGILSDSLNTAVEENMDNFEMAGANAATGAIGGFISKIKDMDKAAIKFSGSAVKTVENEWDINSPSRVFMRIGGYAAQGLINGLNSYTDKVGTASTNLATAARLGMSNAISKLRAAMDTDLENLQPRIRPVLDLSEVEAGANAIGGMLASSPSVNANIGAISSMMNKRQNGNHDIVSAIEKLGKDMSNLGGDTYNMGDVTYDDGSNIATAIQALVQAARIERRR